MFEFIEGLFDSSFMPHGHCYQWRPEIVGLHVFSDTLITLAYYSIPVLLIYFVHKRRDLAFRWMFVLFGTFILACGTTHLLEVWTVWHGTYRLTGVVKLATGLVSMSTAVMLVPLVPKALALPSPAQLRASNQALQREIDERRRVEEQLRQINTELEQRVRERTAELEQRNRQLEQEIEDRRRAEEAMRLAKEEAEAASRVKSAFLANMSHEIRTPLTAIIGFAAVLADEVPGEKQHFARTIVQGGRRLHDMLNAVLTLAKLESEHARFRHNPIDVDAEAHEVVLLLQPHARQRGLPLRYAGNQEDAWAALDRGGLHSILHNLIGNAIKFTERGAVTVRVTTDAEHVLLHVEDTGEGIAPEFLPHLFDQFSQESTGLSRAHEGSGLGLSIVHRLVHRMGGTISVESKKGQGTVFTVSFPRTAPPAATP